jgi:rhodanese-related sulfurtransferase
MTLMLLAGCANVAQTSGDLTADAFAKGIQQPGIQLLDCRTAGEFRSGHLEGALQADWTDATQFAERTRYLDKSKPVYVYCLSGSRSSGAAETLRAQGYREVVNLKGGLIAWKKAGHTLVSGNSGKPETSAAQYAALTNEGSVVLVDFGADWCPPCRKMEPVVDAFIKESKGTVRLVKMDGGVENQLMKQHRVEGLPTFIVYKNGKETARRQGAMSAEELAALVGK